MSQEQQQRKKKVEWSSNLSSSEPQPTETRSPMWDTESDHMLSYFLGNNGVSSPPSGTQFTTTPPSGQTFTGAAGSINGISNPTTASSSAGRPPIAGGPMSNFRPAAAASHGTSILSSSATGNNSNPAERRQDGISADQDNIDDDEDLPGPPPTPAIQHYFQSSSSSSSSKSRQVKAGNTNSILKAPSFDSTQSSHQQHLHQYYPQPPLAPNGMPTIKHGFLPSVAKPHPSHSNSTGSLSLEGGSPISPAMMIGGDHEPMVLPPPDSHAARQSHLEWLRQINAMAQASNVNGVAAATGHAPATPMPATFGMIQSNGAMGMVQMQPTSNPQVPPSVPQAVPHPQQQQQVPSVATFAPPGVPLHPTAAAALAAGNPLFFSHAAALLRHHTSSPVETEEKRAKRLERNRESARKSRRRKKERLSGLEGKVNSLHNKIEAERRIQINSMETILGDHEKEQILRLKEEYSNQEGDDTREERLATALSLLLSSTSEATIRKDIVEFQYSSLSQYLLPRYQKFLLWLLLHPDSFFSAGKEEHAKREAEQPVARGTSGKISSKQIGDELTNGRKMEGGRFIPPPPPPAYAQQHGENSEKGSSVAKAFDAARMWPLTCFELSVSVDQEDRLMSVLKRVKENEQYPKKNSQIAAATRMTYNLKEAVKYQVYISSFRKRKAFLDILTPKQALLYKEWLLSNRERCKQALDERRKVSPPIVTTNATSASGGKDGNLTLEDLCRTLEEILKISKVTSSDTPMSVETQQQFQSDYVA